MIGRGRAIGLVLVGLVAAGLVAGRAVGRRRFEAELGRARAEAEAGEYAAARDRLARLSSDRPDVAEVRYRLGLAERALGHPLEAIRAWDGMGPGSPLGVQVALAKAQILIRSFGRLDEAEVLLRLGLGGPVAVANPSRWALAEVLVWQGRIDEARRLLEAGWDRTPESDRVALLREHWRLDGVVVAEGEVRPVLDAADRHAPGDRGARLVRAGVATGEGRFAPAWTLLEGAGDDPIAWQARLAWSVAADRPDRAAEALARLPDDRLGPAEVLALRAWFGARRGDPEAERSALLSLVALDPGRTTALDRLAVLSRSDEDRRRKGEADLARQRYRWTILGLPADPARGQVEDLARQAEALGRDFEAQGWWSLALSRAHGDFAPRDALDRLARRVEGRTVPPDAMPAALRADLAKSPPAPSRDGAPATAPAFVDGPRLPASYRTPNSPLHQIPEVLGGGVAMLDYDGDGRLDLYLVQGGAAFPPPAGATCGDRLYRNRGDGSFEDVSISSKITSMPGGFGFGVAVGDTDNDGRPDLFVTRWGSYALYRNKGDGTFEDATARAGLGGDRGFPTSAAFADLDNDGDLDLYVCHYLRWDADSPPTCRSRRHPGRAVSCLPLGFPSEPDHLFRNDGGRFVDVTAGSGLVDPDGRGLGVVAADLDGDGRVDLYVANDQSANYLFRNLGGLRFEEVGAASGSACGADGVCRAGMGVACGDLDGDGRPDLAVTNFFGESTTFYRNLGGGSFEDRTAAVGLAAPTRFLLGFGVAFLDADDDGLLDLASANGHVSDESPTFPHAMPAQLLVGTGGGRLADVSSRAGPPWNRPVVGRGLAVGDIDDDGRLDVVLIPQDAPPIVARNVTAGGHSVGFRLEGTASNRDGVGARVSIRAGGRTRTAWRIGGGSYLSASDPRLHFGLGPSRVVDEVEVAWPSGRVDRFRDLPGDRSYLVREGAARPEPIRGPGSTGPD